MNWHLKQAKHNLETNKYLSEVYPKYEDWEYTTLFYSVIHLVETYLYENGEKNIQTHNHRRELIKCKLKEIVDPYLEMEETSRKMRYNLAVENIQKQRIENATKNYQIIKKIMLEKINVKQ